MKTIIVIEDSIEDLEIINLHCKGFDVYPNAEDERAFFNKLRGNIDKYYCHSSKNTTQKAMGMINDFMNKHEKIDLFIIDYQLKEGIENGVCNGISFYKDFIFANEKFCNMPVLFLTRVADNDIDNDLLSLQEEMIKEGKKIKLLKKTADFKKESFKKLLRSKINELIGNEDLDINIDKLN